jgi:hypothetical protein
MVWPSHCNILEHDRQANVTVRTQIGLDARLTCRAEEKDIGLFEILIDLIAERDLSVSERRETILILRRHFSVDIVEENGPRTASEFG